MATAAKKPAPKPPAKPAAKPAVKASPPSQYGVNLAGPVMPAAPSFNVSNPQSIADAVQKSTDQANAANNARYGQGIGVLSGGLSAGRTDYGNAAQNQAGAYYDLTKGYAGGQDYISQAIANSALNGQQATQQNQQQLQNAQAHTQQSAISRGIGNTTIADSLANQNQRTADLNQQGINEQVANRLTGLNQQQANLSTQQGTAQAAQQNNAAQLNVSKAGLENQGANSISNFIASRNDVAPNLGQFASLAQGAAAAPNPNAPKRTATIVSGGTGALGSSPFTSGGGSSSSSSMGSAMGSSGGGGGSPQGGGSYFSMGGAIGGQQGSQLPQAGGNQVGGASIFGGQGSSAGTGPLANILSSYDTNTGESFNPNTGATVGDAGSASATSAAKATSVAPTKAATAQPKCRPVGAIWEAGGVGGCPSGQRPVTQ